MKENIDLGDARKEFHTREGGVSQETSIEEARVWMYKVIDTLQFQNGDHKIKDPEDQKSYAKTRGLDAIKYAKKGTPLQNDAKNFLQELQMELKTEQDQE